MEHGTVVAGKYRVRRLLGKGGMGAVYEAEHVELGKRVALKTISSTHTGNPEVVKRFRREARAASAVQSDGIVDVYDVGEDPAVGVYMVMEFLEGEDLATRLAREQRLEPLLAGTIALQVARALARAHAAGIVHRDLKPANLFLATQDDGSLRTKIVDFGISKILDDARLTATGDALTRKGAMLGTPLYMSPEQAQGAASMVDARSDVWALGAVFYEMLSGRPAYLPTSYEALLIDISTRPPDALAHVAPWVPAPLVAVIDEAMALDLARRLPNAGAFAQRLAEALAIMSRAPVAAAPSQMAVGAATEMMGAPPTGAIAGAAPVVAPTQAATMRFPGAPMPPVDAPRTGTLPMSPNPEWGRGLSGPSPLTPYALGVTNGAADPSTTAASRSSARRAAIVIVALAGLVLAAVGVVVVVFVVGRLRASGADAATGGSTILSPSVSAGASGLAAGSAAASASAVATSTATPVTSGAAVLEPLTTPMATKPRAPEAGGKTQGTSGAAGGASTGSPAVATAPRPTTAPAISATAPAAATGQAGRKNGSVGIKGAL